MIAHAEHHPQLGSWSGCVDWLREHAPCLDHRRLHRLFPLLFSAGIAAIILSGKFL